MLHGRPLAWPPRGPQSWTTPGATWLVSAFGESLDVQLQIIAGRPDCPDPDHRGWRYAAVASYACRIGGPPGQAAVNGRPRRGDRRNLVGRPRRDLRRRHGREAVDPEDGTQHALSVTTAP